MYVYEIQYIENKTGREVFTELFSSLKKAKEAVDSLQDVENGITFELERLDTSGPSVLFTVHCEANGVYVPHVSKLAEYKTFSFRPATITRRIIN